MNACQTALISTVNHYAKRYNSKNRLSNESFSPSMNPLLSCNSDNKCFQLRYCMQWLLYSDVSKTGYNKPLSTMKNTTLLKGIILSTYSMHNTIGSISSKHKPINIEEPEGKKME